MQTILGANGHIGRPLAVALATYTNKIRLVSRSPQAINPGDQLHAADLFDRSAVLKAVEGSEIVYLTIGIPYHDKVWAQHWVPLIKNVIDACEQAKAKLVFFDNVYMYHPDHIDGMNEQALVAPQTTKGKVRAEVARLVTAAHRAGRIQTVIARAADFYGPACKSSVLHDSVVLPAAQGKTMRWLYDMNQPHNFTYTLDAAKATAQLGNDPTAYGRVWHLPSSPAFTGKEWMEKIWTSAGSSLPAKTATLPAWMVPIIGLFISEIKSLHKMRYQYQNPYRLDDSDFVKKYGWKATPVSEALEVITTAAKKDN